MGVFARVKYVRYSWKFDRKRERERKKERKREREMRKKYKSLCKLKSRLTLFPSYILFISEKETCETNVVDIRVSTCFLS